MYRSLLLFSITTIVFSSNYIFGQTDEAVSAGKTPLPPGIVYPQWCLSNFEKKSNYEVGASIVRHVEVEELQSRESAAKASSVLKKMVGFLHKQDSATFTLEYELNSQTTMGFIETGNNPFESFDFAFSKPNLLKIPDRRQRDEKYHWEIGSDGTYALRTDSGSAMVEDAAEELPELLQQDTLALGYAYSVDARGVLSMFHPVSFEKWNQGRKVYHAGEADFGSLQADHLVFVLTAEEFKETTYKRLHLFVAQGPRPVPLMMVRDGDRLISTYTTNTDDDRADKFTRRLDTEWRFKDWQFNNEFSPDAFQLSMPKQPLVTAMVWPIAKAQHCLVL